MPEAYLVYNPTAGRVPIRPFIQRAQQVLESEGWKLHLRTTRSADHIIVLARQAAQRGMDAFFIAGGDGSLNLAVAGLVGSTTALGVLPAGTANVLAQDLRLPTPSLVHWDAVVDSARLLARAPVYWADVGRCNERYFLMWAGVGLDAEVVSDVEPRARWEKPFTFPKYVFAALKNTAAWSGLDLQVVADGEVVAGKFIIAVATNIRRYAGGVAEISPDAYMDDGQMDLWLFRAEKLSEVAQRLLEVLTHKHLDSAGVKRLPFVHATLKSARPITMHTDGEPNGAAVNIDLSVRKQALRILVPPGGEVLFQAGPDALR